VFVITTAAAQEEGAKAQKHELSIYGLGGLSSLSYTLSNSGSRSGGMGGGAGLSYTFNINPSLGMVVGVEMSTYSSEASYSSVPETYKTGTGDNELRFSYSLNNYKETQNVTLFSIPIMAQYSLPVNSGGTIRFYASGGFKLGFPISAKADIAPCTANTSGEFAYENVKYEELLQHGLGNNISLPAIKTAFDLGFSAALALETGVRFDLTDKIGLYTGVYFDYGLNSIQTVNDKHPLEYDLRHLSEPDKVNERPFLYHSILNTGFVDKVNLLSIGLKLRIGFKL
jgi:hypothetical protein